MTAPGLLFDGPVGAPPTIALALIIGKDGLYFRNDDDNRGDCEGDKGDK